MKTKTVTLKQVKAGAQLPPPVYNSKPYVVLSKEDVVLAADTLDGLKQVSSYFDDCRVDVRRHDMHANDNTKRPEPATTSKAPVLKFQMNDGKTVSLYVLDVGQSAGFCRRADGRWQYQFRAAKTASLIYEQSGPAGYSVQEVHLDDANTWAWVQEHMAAGFAAQGFMSKEVAK